MARHLVLVVEDEVLLRLSATSMLEDAGFDTLEAASADEAIRHLETNERIQIVFTDIHMPGSMDGLRLAAAIRNRWPPIELVLTSGHVRVAEQDIPERGRFLPKPYSAEQLVRTMLSFRPSSTQIFKIELNQRRTIVRPSRVAATSTEWSS